MLQGHTFHAMLAEPFREGDFYTLSQFIGGMPAPIFLFLTGVTLAFLLDGKERRGVDATGRFAAALRRAGYLLLIAFGVRLQAYLFGFPWSNLQDLLRVDVLNCMGVSLAILAFTSFFNTAERVKLGLICGFFIASISPLMSGVSWENSPELLRGYVEPRTDLFGLFPWASFTAFGLAFGSMLRMTKAENLNRFLQWTAVAALTLILMAGYFSFIPYSVYKNSDFWVNSPGLVFIKVGIILLLITFAYLWLTYLPVRRGSFVTLLGTSSLLVYWVHLEIVYGRWFWFWKTGLSESGAIFFSIGLTIFMCVLAWAWRRRDAIWTAFYGYASSISSRVLNRLRVSA